MSVYSERSMLKHVVLKSSKCKMLIRKNSQLVIRPAKTIYQSIYSLVDSFLQLMARDKFNSVAHTTVLIVLLFYFLKPLVAIYVFPLQRVLVGICLLIFSEIVSKCTEFVHQTVFLPGSSNGTQVASVVGNYFFGTLLGHTKNSTEVFLPFLLVISGILIVLTASWIIYFESSEGNNTLYILPVNDDKTVFYKH